MTESPTALETKPVGLVVPLALPRIGEIVHFSPADSRECLAAIVTRVTRNGNVSLTAMNPDGLDPWTRLASLDDAQYEPGAAKIFARWHKLTDCDK